jgi:hypothetical protein
LGISRGDRLNLATLSRTSWGVISHASQCMIG